VWSKNTIFTVYSKKFPQISDFPKKWDSNPLSQGDNAADIAKMFAKYKNVDFRERRWGISRKSDRIFLPKNRFFLSQKSAFFVKNTFKMPFLQNRCFSRKSAFFAKNT
jgi:hypothetical protein